MRIEQDKLGKEKFADDDLTGLETRRAVKNFGQAGGRVNPELVCAMITVKKAAAMAYRELGTSPWPGAAAAGEAENAETNNGAAAAGKAENTETERGAAAHGGLRGSDVWDALIAACDRLLEEFDRPGSTENHTQSTADVQFYDRQCSGSSREDSAGRAIRAGSNSSEDDAGRAAALFPTAALQGGAGTSLNMNVNEVLANLTLNILGKPAGVYELVHPLDTVNKGQSTNDVYPTALRIAAIRKLRLLSDECAALQEELQRKEQEFAHVRKLGRTQMMDAMAITLGEELGSYAQAIGRDRWRLYKIEERLRQVNLGGTAVGEGTNADRRYIYKVTEILRDLTDIGLARAEYPMDTTQNQDVFVEVSGLLKALAVNLMKLSGDLRLMNSGPDGGFAEISLPALQKGSTIMPGKVNPVIPEMVTQMSIRVMGHDSEISIAAASGNLELNAFLPLIADSLLDSFDLLIQGTKALREKCIRGMQVNEERCGMWLAASGVDARTKYAAEAGYDAAARAH